MFKTTDAIQYRKNNFSPFSPLKIDTSPLHKFRKSELPGG